MERITMTEPKRKRGRPPGSGGRDDSSYLALIADKLVANPSLKRAAAMNEVKNTRMDWGASDKTLLQRWRDKWSKQEAQLMEAARKRAERRMPSSASGNGYVVTGYGGYSGASRYLGSEASRYLGTTYGLIQSQYERLMLSQQAFQRATLGSAFEAAEIMRKHQEAADSMRAYREHEKVREFERVRQLMKEQESVRELMKQTELMNLARLHDSYRF